MPRGRSATPPGDTEIRGLSLKKRLGILLGFVVLAAVGVGGLFLATGGAELLFGTTVRVTFATVEQQPDNRHVTLTGKLDLPANEAIGEDHLMLYLVDPANSRRRVGISVRVRAEGGTPAPNHMAGLPLMYGMDDLRVRLADGSYVGWGDQVRVTGPVNGCTAGTQRLRCISAEVIEPAD